MSQAAPTPPTSPTPRAAPTAEGRSRRLGVRILLLVIVAGFAAFWTWALFFASKEAVNRIDDRGWAERAEAICLRADEDRLELADFRRIDRDDEQLILERAEIVDDATDILERMLDDVVAVEPTDEKGRAIVPQWEDEYRAYLENRRAYASSLRESGENLAFYETEVDGLPISERLETFAGDNEMPSCAPPRDLSR